MRALATRDLEARRRDLFRRIAFVTRYGHIPYSEAMEIQLLDLETYLEELATLIQQENKATGGK